MKRLTMAAILVTALFLTACTGSGSPGSGGWTSNDWDMNNPSMYNNQTYCHNGIYNPLANGRYSCTLNGKTSHPSPRPKAIIPPKSAQKAPVIRKKSTTSQLKQKKSAPKSYRMKSRK